MADAYIGDKTAGDHSSVTDKTKILVPGADMHSPDINGRGSAQSWDMDELCKVLLYRLVTATGHGLVSGDVGKPLSGSEILDDTDETHYPTGILMQSVNTNVIRVAPPSTDITLDVDLLDGGNAYDIGTSGRYVYWDLSAGIYKATIPIDSAPLMPEILELVSVGASTFVARVRSF